MRQADDRMLVLAPPGAGLTRQDWLTREIRRAILDGRLIAGALLPASRDLARLHGVSRGTVVAAYGQLADEGYVRGQVGRGTVVAARLAEPPRARRPQPVPALDPGLSARGEALARPRFPMVPPAAGTQAFRAGQPDLEAFPLGLWTRLAARRSRLNQRGLLADGDPRGYRPLREAIAAHVAASRGFACGPDDVVVVGSVQQALDLAARLTLDPGDQAVVEDPGYPAAAQVLAAAGAVLVPVSVDAEGLDVADALARAPSARFVHVTPARQAPLGVPLSLARRMRLIAWAAETGAIVFEDDYDGEYRFAGRPLAALKSLDRADKVIYAGTFSKLMFPGLRLAFVVLPDRLREPFAAALSLTARHAPLMTQVVLADFITEGHFGRHVRRMRVIYGERAEALNAAARDYWTGLVAVPPIEAGLDIAARLLRHGDDVAITRRAAAAGIETRPLSVWRQDRKGPATPGLILGFATTPPAMIRAAAAGLARVLEAAPRQ
ncbi:PLP-dependent aminotransferase family protein [Phreatobacter stygius]|uniref:PLP-dependent aminotransferase family protein n=1 Tax=Phreatobacter stygius TaxID=1940610 RepID=A0A4D7AZH1_9HYPH|nr:PLP-dependent aminotransferase family protein [Phreatobacter stygius]QCI63140.1 PLP-dependent aminotransferase family protein [Phreatobacter stygius]